MRSGVSESVIDRVGYRPAARITLQLSNYFNVTHTHTGTAYAKIGDYILGVVFHPKPSSVSDVAGIQSVHASLN